MSERHREALAHLLYGVGGGGGFVLLTGEIGAGKTTVCRCFLEQIPRRCNVAYIFNPKLNAAELLQAICDEFRIPVAPDASGQASMKAHVDALNEYLLKTHAVGQNNVLIIDEAQNLSTEVLEQLRLLTNLETSERKLLQIILIGQPELRQMLAQPELEQLAQRVIARFHLDALSEDETAQYIQHRLATAGLRRGTLFDGKAVRRIHQITKGVPRRINLLCDRALLGAFAESKARVDRTIVDKAAAEVFEGQHFLAHPPAQASASHGTASGGQPHPGHTGHQTLPWADWPRWAWAGLGGSLVLGMAGLGMGAWLHRPGTPATAAPTQALASAASTASRTAPSAPMGAITNGVASGTASAAPSAAVPFAPFAPAPAPASAAELSPQALVQRASTDEAAGWRELAQRWQVKLGHGDPCTQARRQDLVCFRASGGLSLLVQLDRPALLALQDEQGRTRHAVLTQIDARQAWLQVGDATVRMPLSALSSIWRGDFATLWRAPEGLRNKVTQGQSGPAVDWLAMRLAKIDHGPAAVTPARLDAALQARLQAFQLAQGLKPDGVAGATTFMLINRASGVPEPRLVQSVPAPAADRPSPPRR
ncbi:type II secretion system protein A [Aquabacterium commune]|uniref:Type II secretion system protein A n=2 Tax=Aquabacterium commune TaxID=70586 RepID=A0A4R6R4Q4_9BURK|nr:type II secretion system protein A [Aquabacterium commune]